MKNAGKMPKFNFHSIETITFILITLFGVANGQVTVFYIIYLFWFQELLRNLVDFVIVVRQEKNIAEKRRSVTMAMCSFFILFVYLVVIIQLFGFKQNFGNTELLRQNVLTFLFRNWFFNINIVLFLAEYIYYRMYTDNSDLEILPFNRRHIILHLSIILGSIIQGSTLRTELFSKLNIEGDWASALVVLPFLILKILIYRPKK